MGDQKTTILAVDLWLSDLALTLASFLLAYRLRLLFALGGHTVMPFGVYAPALAFILPAWAIALPLFRVYSKPALQSLAQALRRLNIAVVVAWFVAAGAQVFFYRNSSNRLILLFTLAIDLFLLAAYRVLVFRKQRLGAAARSSI